MESNFLKTLIVLALIVGLVAYRTKFYRHIPAIAAFLAKRSREKLSGFEERHADIVGEKLSWLDSGESNKPTVLLVHPFGVDKGVWLATGTRLRDAGFRVIAPDLLTGVDGRKLEVTALARRLKATIYHAKAIRPHVVGAGLGGTVAAALACASPKEIASLTLIEPLGFGSPYASDFDRLLEKGRNPLIPTSAGQLDPFFRLLSANPDAIPEAERKRLGALALAQAGGRERLWQACLGGDKARMLDVLLPEIRVKTLILWGARSRIAPPENAEAVRGIMSDARLSVVPDSGHLMMLDRPDAIASGVRELIGMAT